MPDDERDLPIGDEELSKLEEIVDDALEEDEVGIGIDLDKNGKPDVFISFKGKSALVVAVVVGICIVVTKLFGLW